MEGEAGRAGGGRCVQSSRSAWPLFSSSQAGRQEGTCRTGRQAGTAEEETPCITGRQQGRKVAGGEVAGKEEQARQGQAGTGRAGKPWSLPCSSRQAGRHTGIQGRKGS